MLGTLIRLKLITPPLAAKNQPIGITRGPGRPKKAVKALFFQPEQYNTTKNYDSDASSNNDNDEETLASELTSSTNTNLDIDNNDDGTDDDAYAILDQEEVLVATRAITGSRGGSRSGEDERGRGRVIREIVVPWKAKNC